MFLCYLRTNSRDSWFSFDWIHFECPNVGLITDDENQPLGWAENLANSLSGSPGDLPRISSSYRDRMCQESLKASKKALRIMVEPDLVQHGASIVVDAFTRQLPLLIECVESA